MNPVDSSAPRMAPPRRRTFQRFFAWILTVVGLLFVLLVLFVPDDPTIDAATARENEQGTVVIFVFGGILLASGAAWLVALRRHDAKVLDQFGERAVLAVAARHGGRATIAQITLETPLSSDQAEAIVNRLCGRNIAQPDLLDDGTVVYQFGMLGGRIEG